MHDGELAFDQDAAQDVAGEDQNLSRTGKLSRQLARLNHLIDWFDR